MSLIELKLDPTERFLRQFAVIGFPIAGGLWGAVAWFHFEWPTVAIVLWSVAGLIAVIGAVAPKSVRPIYIVMILAGYPFGVVVSIVILALIYYGVIAPIGWVMRRLGHDPLALRKGISATTYWISSTKGQIPPEEERRRFFRQS